MPPLPKSSMSFGSIRNFDVAYVACADVGLAGYLTLMRGFIRLEPGVKR